MSLYTLILWATQDNDMSDFSLKVLQFWSLNPFQMCSLAHLKLIFSLRTFWPVC